MLSLVSPIGRMGDLGHCVIGGMPILSPDQVMERIDAVSVGQLRELASELYRPSSLSVAGIGPDEQAFMGALKPLGAKPGRDDASADAVDGRDSVHQGVVR